jgi:hypothetical protein
MLRYPSSFLEKEIDRQLPNHEQEEQSKYINMTGSSDGLQPKSMTVVALVVAVYGGESV